MSLPLHRISTRVLEGMKESKAVQALAGAQQHQQLLRPLEVGIIVYITLELILGAEVRNHNEMHCLLFYLQVGGVGRNLQAQVWEVLAGEITQPLVGRAKLQEMVKATADGMMVLTTRVATTPVIPGAITNLTGMLCFK